MVGRRNGVGDYICVGEEVGEVGGKVIEGDVVGEGLGASKVREAVVEASGRHCEEIVFGRVVREIQAEFAWSGAEASGIR